MAFEELRARMVEDHLKARGLTDPRLLRAFHHVPRHLFVPPELTAQAYADQALPIGEGQTISQPYIVALMIHCLRLQGHERVLEVGTGSGYETAILSELALEVYSVERVPELLDAAKERLERLGYATNAHFRLGDGSLGWPDDAPYEAIIVSASAPRIPRPLVEQLDEGGRLILPVGTPQVQTLMQVEKHRGAVERREVAQCVFIPLIGEHGWPDER